MKTQHPPLQPPSIAITGVGLACCYGNHPAALLGGVGTRLSYRRAVPNLQVPGPNNRPQQAFWAPIQEYPTEELNSEIRLHLLQEDALLQLCAFLPKDSTGTRLLLIVLQPDPGISCAGSQDEAGYVTGLQSIHPALQSATIRIAAVTDGATVVLQQAVAEAQQGLWDRVIFGAADSLIDRNTLLQLASQNRCCTFHNPDRLLAGEGAAYLLLEPGSLQKTGIAWIRGLTQDMEPNVGYAASRRTPVLGEVAEAAMNQADQEPGQLNSIVVGHSQDEAGILEWHQAERHLWKKDGFMPEHIEEWNPQLFLGYLGAATLPLALVLGCARFAFNFPSAASVLVCEAGLSPPRGAICLRPPQTDSPGRKT